jgi:hypothetical protein
MRTTQLLKIMTVGFLFLSLSSNAQAEKEKKTTQQFSPINYCQQSSGYSEEHIGVKVVQLYISEANGIVWETCLQAAQAKLSLKESGDLVLLERGINTKVEYYNSGSRSGRVKKIDDISIDYYTAGYYKKGKPRKIGNITIDYYSSGYGAGRVKQIGNIFLDYYTQGSEKGRLKRINTVNFSYIVNLLIAPDGKGKERLQMQTSGSFQDVPMIII